MHSHENIAVVAETNGHVVFRRVLVRVGVGQLILPGVRRGNRLVLIDNEWAIGRRIEVEEIDHRAVLHRGISSVVRKSSDDAVLLADVDGIRYERLVGPGQVPVP